MRRRHSYKVQGAMIALGLIGFPIVGAFLLIVGAVALVVWLGGMVMTGGRFDG